MSIYNLESGLDVFKALSSHTRAMVFDLIRRQGGMSIKQIAQALDIPITTLSPHISTLKKCGLIYLVDKPVGRGVQKCCYPHGDTDQLVIDLSAESQPAPLYSAEISVGAYSDFEVTPTCGLATAASFIGQLDEPRYFAHPTRGQADILWFTTGYVEYILPNFIPGESVVEQLSLTFEISSEAPGIRDRWPSDITFSLNGVTLGTWTSPGDYGDRPGKANPSWWFPFLNQYGLQKKLSITGQGTFLDAERLSDATPASLGLTYRSILKFRFSVLPDSPHPGGITLFGNGFGDHGHNLQLSIRYRGR
ncbi:MAG: helix-turn-helix domain-containing protein [Eubacteriales bacterium]|nr:helix-turn-helix domain-containing protein [Eubacteriales bacterium]